MVPQGRPLSWSVPLAVYRLAGRLGTRESNGWGWHLRKDCAFLYIHTLMNLQIGFLRCWVFALPYEP
jgi:hypothetical protein